MGPFGAGGRSRSPRGGGAVTRWGRGQESALGADCPRPCLPFGRSMCTQGSPGDRRGGGGSPGRTRREDHQAFRVGEGVFRPPFRLLSALRHFRPLSSALRPSFGRSSVALWSLGEGPGTAGPFGRPVAEGVASRSVRDSGAWALFAGLGADLASPQDAAERGKGTAATGVSTNPKTSSWALVYQTCKSFDQNSS